MSRMEYDDAFLRYQKAMGEEAEAREETRRLAAEKEAQEHRRDSTRTQHILMGATVAYSILTLLMAVAVGVQAWAAWKQTRQPVQPPIVNITVPK